MAKSRRNRGGASQRRDPISKPVKPPSDPELAALREARILPIIRDLIKADPKSRSAAASAIANLIHDTRCRKLLLREQVVHTVLTQTLTDASWESRAAGWGILQVLAQEEEADFCVHLFRRDVLTAIEHAARTVGEKLVAAGQPALASLPRGERTLVASIAASLVALLTALAEAGDEPLEAISSNATVTDLLFLLVTPTGLADLAGDALACLMVLTEDNPRLAGRLVANAECYRALSALKDQVSGDGVLACATLHNVFAALETPDGASRVPDDDSVLIPTLAKTIAAVQPGQHAADGAEPGWSSPLEQQQLALETLASIGTALIPASSPEASAPRTADRKRGAAGPKGKGEKEEDNDDDDDDDDDDMGMGEEADGQVHGAKDGDDDDDQDSSQDEDEEMDDDAMEADMDMVTGADDADEQIDTDEAAVLKALIQLAIPELTRIVRLPLAAPSGDDQALLRLQTHALSALNNTAWSLSLVAAAAVQRAWLPVARTLWRDVITPMLASDTADVGLAAQVTGLAWALARVLAGHPSRPLDRAAGQHRSFISLYRAAAAAPASDADADADADPLQRLGVKCIGVLGQLALHPCPSPLNLEIASFLLDILDALPATPAADAVEALNQMLDIYASEDYPYDADVFWAHDLLTRLENLVPSARAMARSVDKKVHPELRTRADEVVLNLTRFLTYKKKHRPKTVLAKSKPC